MGRPGRRVGVERSGADADLTAPLLARNMKFTLERPVVMARLYLCGLGLYELSINGARR